MVDKPQLITDLLCAQFAAQGLIPGFCAAIIFYHSLGRNAIYFCSVGNIKECNAWLAEKFFVLQDGPVDCQVFCNMFRFFALLMVLYALEVHQFWWITLVTYVKYGGIFFNCLVLLCWFWCNAKGSMHAVSVLSLFI